MKPARIHQILSVTHITVQEEVNCHRVSLCERWDMAAAAAERGGFVRFSGISYEFVHRTKFNQKDSLDF